jgi:5-methylcytosine-specific restriction endonuclease McrA
MDAAVRELVRHRAGNRCEYCRVKQEYLSFSSFEVEHIIPRKHGGDDNPTNLALAAVAFLTSVSMTIEMPRLQAK